MSGRRLVLYEYKGQKKTATDWARYSGMSPQLMRFRLRIKGMSIKEAIETPVINKGQGRKEIGLPQKRPKLTRKYSHGKPKECTYPNCEKCPFPDCYY